MEQSRDNNLEFLEVTPQAPPASGRLKLAGFAMLAGMVVAFVVFGLQLANQNRVQPRPGEIAPDFTLTTFEGETITLADLRGKVVLLNFWGSWCAPCHAEAEDLEDIWRQYQDENFVLIGVNWLDTESSALEFMERYDLTFINGPDIGERITREYAIQAAPETFIIDQNGEVVEFIRSTINADTVGATIERLLATTG